MRELRIASSEIRCAGMSPKAMRVSGMAARYEMPTVIGNKGKPFRETIARGAFAKAVATKQDTRLYINHDINRIMGRVSAGTLRLRDTNDGLYFEADLPDTEDARSVYSAVQRGDMRECSFGFQDAQDDWSVETANGVRMISRTIRNVGTLADVSIVTEPAYGGTSVQARSERFEQRSITIPDFVLEELEHGDDAQLRRKQLLGAILL
jgi:HK97 family phage prohead protease